MKRIIAILLSLTLLVSAASMLAGCQEQEEGENKQLLVGYGRADITPESSVPLAGYGNESTRLSQSVRDPLYATCIAVTAEDGTTILLYSLDLGRTPGLELGTARKVLKEQLGVSASNVIFCATHNHAGPDMKSTWEGNANMEAYYEKLENALIQAGLDAWNDRKEATMHYSSTEVTGMNAVRHYVMDDGSISAGNATGTGTTVISSVTKADNELQVLLFRRDGDKDIVMVNWQSHPIEYFWEGLGANDTTVTADIVGATRDYIERQLNCDFIYFTGASGNVNCRSMVTGANVHDNLEDYGEKFGKYVMLAMSDMEDLKVDTAQVLRKDITYKNGKSTMTVDVFQLGEMGFACVPYEMFDTNGMFIKENSPYKHTFILYFGNGSGPYIPAEAAYNYGGYEVDFGIPKGSAEELANGYVALLEELHGSVAGGDGNE